ncbi:hypothetical protein E4U43_007622 [Claviceps pusilla]|uniref:Uncharacterized protein n=1 Tax=Claviceps pusilla TaxID=123648 RepID=A0A9P7NEG3_9HYPO|nr:hypothetical protein E4U43_007622 [Claviceps pusilla]
MKAFIFAAAAMFGAAYAGKATIVNNCEYTVYAQSFPFAGGNRDLATIESKKSWSEDLIRDGNGDTIKVAKDASLSGPLFFAYSFSSNPNTIYYEMNSQWGNPFGDKHNILSTNKDCPALNCGANDAGCYSTPGNVKNPGCAEPADLTLTLCA